MVDRILNVFEIFRLQFICGIVCLFFVISSQLNAFTENQRALSECSLELLLNKDVTINDNIHKSYIKHNSCERVSGKVYAFIDKSNVLTIDDILKNDSLFSQVTNSYLDFSFFQKQLWLKVTISNLKNEEYDGYLYFDNSLIDYVDFYERKGITNIFEKTQSTGGRHQYMDKSVSSLLPSVKIILQPNRENIYYFSVKSRHPIYSKLIMSTHKNIDHVEAKTNVVIFFYIGAIVVLTLYNLFLFLYSRDRNYLIYVCFVLSFFIMSLNLRGFWDYTFRFETFNFYVRSIAFTGLTGILGIKFSQKLLKLPRYAPRYSKMLDVLSYLGMFHLLGFIEYFYNILEPIFYYTIDLFILSSSTLMFLSSVVAHFRGLKIAKFFVGSWACLYLAIIVWFARYAGLIGPSIMTTNSLLWGNIFEMLVISLALAYKIKTLEKEREAAEIKAQGKDLYDKLLRLLCHDVSNSLSIVLFYSKIFKNADDEKIVKSKEAWPKVSKACENIKSILENVRNEAFLQSKKNSLALTPIIVKEILEDGKLIFEHQLLEKNIILDVVVNDERLVVFADRVALLNHVINNALSNAIKFAKFNVGKILVSAYVYDEKIFIDIVDNGIGIPVNILEKILDDKNKQEAIGDASRIGTMGELGTGYGMVLLRSYMEMFGGKVEIISRINKTDEAFCNNMYEDIVKESGTVVRLIFPATLNQVISS